MARYLAALVVVAAGYYVLAKLGLRLASINPSASPIWPPTGLALAAVLLGGLRIWPAIFIGAFAANATTAGTLETSALIALGNTLESVAGGYLIGRWAGGAQTFDEPRAGGEIRARCGRAATVISASIGVVTLCVAGLCGLDEIHPDLGHLVAGRRGRRAGGDAGDRAVGAERAPQIRLPGLAGLDRRVRTRRCGRPDRLQSAFAASRLHPPARVPGDSAAGVGGAALRPARYRDGRTRADQLCRLGDDRTCRAFRRNGPQRILRRAADVHAQRLGAEPCFERRCGDAQPDGGQAAPHPSRPRSARQGAYRGSRRRQYPSDGGSAPGQSRKLALGYPGQHDHVVRTVVRDLRYSAEPVQRHAARIRRFHSPRGPRRRFAPASAPPSRRARNSATKSVSCGRTAASGSCKASAK